VTKFSVLNQVGERDLDIFRGRNGGSVRVNLGSAPCLPLFDTGDPREGR